MVRRHGDSFSVPRVRAAGVRATIGAPADSITIRPGGVFVICADWEYRGPPFRSGLLVVVYNQGVQPPSAPVWYAYELWDDTGADDWQTRNRCREFELTDDFPTGTFDVDVRIIDYTGPGDVWSVIGSLRKSNAMTVSTEAPPPGDGNGGQPPAWSSKLGGFSQRNDTGVLNACGFMGSKGWVLEGVALDLCDAMKSAHPDVQVMGRLDVPGHSIGVSLDQAYTQGWNLARYVAARAGNADIIMSVNEPANIGLETEGSHWFRQLLNQHELGFVRGAHTDGKLACVLNLSIGVDSANTEEQFKSFIGDFVECLGEADYFGVHAYGHGRLQDDASWYALRYRRYAKAAQQLGIRCPPFIIGECGTMPGPWDPSMDMSQQEVCDDFRWFSGQIKGDTLVAWAAAWIIGGFGWETWELWGSTVPECVGQR